MLQFLHTATIIASCSRPV